MPARIGYPRGLDGLTDGISGPAYAAVQGLILYGINDDGLDIGSNAAFTPAKPKAGDIVQKVTGFFKNLMP
jgi:cell division protein FtsA